MVVDSWCAMVSGLDACLALPVCVEGPWIAPGEPRLPGRVSAWRCNHRRFAQAMAQNSPWVQRSACRPLSNVE